MKALCTVCVLCVTLVMNYENYYMIDFSVLCLLYYNIVNILLLEQYCFNMYVYKETKGNSTIKLLYMNSSLAAALCDLKD